MVIVVFTVSLDDLEGMLPPPSRPVTLEEMDRAIRERAAVKSNRDRTQYGTWENLGHPVKTITTTETQRHQEVVFVNLFNKLT